MLSFNPGDQILVRLQGAEYKGIVSSDPGEGDITLFVDYDDGDRRVHAMPRSAIHKAPLLESLERISVGDESTDLAAVPVGGTS